MQVATGFAFSTFVLLPKFMVEELQASPSQVGWVAAGFGLCSLCALPLVGRLLDGGHSRPAIVLGSCLMAASAFGFIAVNEPVRLPFALRFVQGVCVSLVVNGGSLLVSQIAPAARLTEAIGVFDATEARAAVAFPTHKLRFVNLALFAGAFFGLDDPRALRMARQAYEGALASGTTGCRASSR